MAGRLACPICRTRPPRRACGNRVFASAHCPVCLETAEPVVALPCGHALCEGCFGRIPGGALLVDGQSVGAAPRPAEDARASEAQDRDARRQRREEAARDREDAAARREAVERSRREAAEERERQREAAAARAEEVQCVICQETIRGGDQRLPCAHVFHRACLQRWLPEHRSCPVCRTPVSAAEQSAPASARPMERGRDDPNAALYARLQAQHEEHNAEAGREAERARAELRAAREEAARREAARAREAELRAARDEVARRERARAAFHVGQRVEVGGWPAKITAVRGDRLYDILYDDGGISRGKCESLIRRPAAPPPCLPCRVCGGNFPHRRGTDNVLRCSRCGSWGAGAATTAQPGHSSPQPGGRRTDGLISTDEIAGCWVCMCFPFGFTAIFSKEVTGPDSIKHAGLILNPVFWPFEEHRIRHPGTNGFYKVGEPQDVDQYSSKDCVCNGLACSMKLC